MTAVSTSISSSSSCPLLSAASHSTGSNVIAMDTNVEIKTSDFSRAYQRALASNTTRSCLKLDHSNKGFRLLSQLGWKENEGGLGRRRQGNLEPIKTMLQRNKMGLGAAAAVGSKMKARITHLPKPPKTMHRPNQHVGKKFREREQASSSCRDKEIRFMLRTDVSEEYVELYRSLHVSSQSAKDP